MNDHDEQSITQGGFEFAWEPDDGLFLIMSRPVMCSWTETTMAYFMSGLHKMVGTDRFSLALYAAGEDTSPSEWERLVPAGALLLIAAVGRTAWAAWRRAGIHTTPHTGPHTSPDDRPG